MAATILVVDDEFTLVESLLEILEWEGFEVVSAQNGAEALAAMERTEPALVLVDFMMPRMDGVQFLRELRRRGNEVPAVLMTAVPSDLPANEGLWRQVLHKPFGLEALLRAIGKALE